METFPNYAEILFAAFDEDFEPSVERTEMERGVPRQRLLNTHVLQTMGASALFRSEQAASDFEDWYFNRLQRIGWFNVRNPRTGQTVRARFQAGRIGRLEPLAPGFRLSKRDFVLEYLR